MTVITGLTAAEVKGWEPLSTTPVFSVLDIEYADDTVVMAKTARVAQRFLISLEVIAARFGLHLNKTKTLELAINSDQRLSFLDGTLVPRKEQTKYLGVIIQARGTLESE
eukprot:13085902-Alexandrium_andersonii.AAC.1